MGGKKSTRKPVKKAPRPKLEKTFSCPFCNHENSIECKIDRTVQTGTATCKICSASYQTIVNCKVIFNDLSEPIDIYSEWIDAIHERETGKSSKKKSS